MILLHYGLTSICKFLIAKIIKYCNRMASHSNPVDQSDLELLVNPINFRIRCTAHITNLGAQAVLELINGQIGVVEEANDQDIEEDDKIGDPTYQPSELSSASESVASSEMEFGYDIFDPASDLMGQYQNRASFRRTHDRGNRAAIDEIMDVAGNLNEQLDSSGAVVSTVPALKKVCFCVDINNFSDFLYVDKLHGCAAEAINQSEWGMEEKLHRDTRKRGQTDSSNKTSLGLSTFMFKECPQI
jgi:hypothetical protein